MFSFPPVPVRRGQGYNGKPVLINKSGMVSHPTAVNGDGARISQTNVIQMNINVWKFAFVAKKALAGLQEKFEKLSLNVGFTIEGRGDEELPECLLGCANLKGVDVNRAVEI